MASSKGSNRRAVVLISRRDALSTKRDVLGGRPPRGLGARFAPVGRVVGPVSGPTRLAGTLLLSRLARLQSIWPSQRSNSWWMRCHRPVACQSPEPSPAGHARTTAQFFGEQFPGDPAAHHKENTGQDLSVRHSGPAAAWWRLTLARWYPGLQATPERTAA